VVPVRMFPEEGTKDEFKQVVLSAIRVEMCIDCLNGFHTLAPQITNSWARCPMCQKRKSDAVFSEDRYKSFNAYIPQTIP